MASDAPTAGQTTLIRPSELHTYKDNPRRGDVSAIEDSLLVNGQYKQIVANIGTHTGRPNEVLAGNHTLAAFRNVAERRPFEAKWQQIKVRWVDVDESEARHIVLVDNRSFDAGEGVDDKVVYELLSETGIEGTGFDSDEFDRLQAAQGLPEDLPKPHLPGDKDSAVISAGITFDNESQQETWFGFLRWLRDQYPDPDMTVGDRVVAHLNDTAEARH